MIQIYSTIREQYLNIMMLGTNEKLSKKNKKCKQDSNLHLQKIKFQQS
ncbi:hypothetical protein T03_1987 [Trichinella britovi]|uniref:Uncharacterized protein n=1 Tax=Trichinella britovi TaxID=45882 RepID=A0A0V1AMK4_TRIBR|nr:hypothetical protein T03_1987 [Trichinella britovi]